jgi:hypothetical protein
MRAIYFLTIFLICFTSGFSFFQAETYHIIYVKGEVLIEKDKRLLKIGMKIGSEDRLIFKNKDAKVIVMSNLRGRFVLMLNNPQQTSELIAIVKEVISPLKTNAAMSTRGAPKIMRDLADYFGNEVFFIVGDTLTFEADRSKFKINDNQYFQIQYKLGDSLVKKKLESANNLVTLNTQDLFKDKQGKFFLPEEVEIYWFVHKPRAIGSRTRFQPVIISKDELKAQYAELLKLIENQTLSKEAYTDYILSYFRDVYGKTDENALESWVEENFKK